MIFGVDIADIVSTAFDGQLQTAVLTRESAGTYDPVTDEYSSVSSQNTYITDGIIQNYSDKMISEGLVQQNDRKILLTAKKLGTTPVTGDSVTIEGFTFTVVGTPERDPAGATWIIQARGSGEVIERELLELSDGSKMELDQGFMEVIDG